MQEFPREVYWGSILYLLYTCDIPCSERAVIGTFTNDTALFSIGDTKKKRLTNYKVQ